MSHHGRLPIPDSELNWKFSRSSGPGGQHVNTSDTRVELTWSLTDTTVLSPRQKELAAERLKNRLTNGTITVVSSSYRSQHRNREAALARLSDLVSRAVVPPKQRHATKPTAASRRRRLDAKKQRSDLKRSRRSQSWD